MLRIRRVIISVFDKTGLDDFARKLSDFGVEIISTGGTAEVLKKQGLMVTSVSDIAGFPEILNGRVKTLHPMIYGGLLALRDDAGHQAEVAEHGIALIDMVVVNLYPFEDTIADPEVGLAQALENIDIGGPCMIRAAAKNHLHVAAVTSPRQYKAVLTEMTRNEGCLSTEYCRRLAVDAFRLTAHYDEAISNYLNPAGAGEALPQDVRVSLTKLQDLRYGENPHQKAAFYCESGKQKDGLAAAEQLHGKPLSYNNFVDADAALGIVKEFSEPCVALVKHSNPCGVATGATLVDAYVRAKETDPVSAFGGIVGVNRPLDVGTANEIIQLFTEVVVAPDFSPEALSVLQSKKNLRLLKLDLAGAGWQSALEIKRIRGGLLLQDQDFLHIHDIDFRVVSGRQPTEQEWQALKFAWRVCKWVKSNAIVYASSDQTLGIGAGQMSRVDSSRIAVEKAARMELELAGSVMASDAFFPFRDGVDVAAQAGAVAIIQPGGSIRDEEVIAAVDEHGMAMVFTGVRHFRH